MRADIYPVKGQYLPNERVFLRFDSGGIDIDMIRITLYSVGREVRKIELPVSGRNTDIDIGYMEGRNKGYGVKAELYRDETKIDEIYTAFDVSEPGYVIRYGFLTDFGKGEEDDADVTEMAKYHINTVQFYDWSYRPDSMVPPFEEYSDLMEKKNNRSVVTEKIKQCHERGMRAIGYGAIYAASEDYQEAHPGQSLFARPDSPLCFIGRFYIMNISRDCLWRQHIIGQYKEAVREMGFDGIHMDTYGFPKAALDYEGNVVYLEKEFNSLIEDTRNALTQVKESPCLIFNNVGGWPAETTRHAPQECVYIEVWPPLDRYWHLRQLIQDAKQGGKPVVLAAYPAPFRTDSPERALESELLCSLTISLCGGTQLFIGENNAVTTQGYYADYSILNERQIQTIRAYQDFFVQYQELLLDSTLRDVSLTHIGWDNTEYECSANYSVTGEPGKLWLIIRENERIKLIGAVNLQGNDNTWNTGKLTPEPLYATKFGVQVLREKIKVFYASPDDNGGIATELPFKIEPTERGNVAYITVPVIKHGGIMWIEEQ